MSYTEKMMVALTLAGLRPDPVVLDPDIMVGPIVFSGTLPDNATTAGDLTLGEGTSGAPLRSEDFDVQFPSSNGVKPAAILLVDAVSIDINVGTDLNGISAANWAALIAPGGARLHWSRQGVHRRYEFAHFANIMHGQAISDTSATTIDARLNPRAERRVLTIPTGHLEVDMERDTFEIEIGAAVNFTGTFAPPYHLFIEGVAISKRAVPTYVASPICTATSASAAAGRAARQQAKVSGRALQQIARR